MTSIEGEPLLLEDLIGRQTELRSEFEQTVNKSQGWLRDELEERVRKRFFGIGFLMRQLFRREQLKTLLADARQEFKEHLTRTATDDERVLLQEAVEIAVTLRRVEALILLHKALKLWIAPHVLATSLMLALMLVHIIQVIFFSQR
jgi:hypothetical protein